MASSGAVDPAGGNYHNPGSNRSKHSLRSSIRDACEDTKLCSTAGASRDLCHGYPVPDRQDIARVTPVTFPAIATAMVLLRFVSRLIVAKKLWWDDWTALIAAVGLLHPAVCQLS
ncbi:hypothetical protein CH063_07076 [Colletotrichum higginsianum]|uniref:Integral membrane protein n=1 Tax=Colletotrichum higginsianum (strain IMI 349063) TaxID=759273 RepID=H1V4U5_COLHI|nr:Integral membrane protein [Colletotrichum higginsianum IMI 349063]OBR12820.1 Integral membrane protein [Colletotrichum higginsianum IMI 349063]CCF35247.1 hypothetical protein CH063_07076 [Colletotrichum higginsianum]